MSLRRGVLLLASDTDRKNNDESDEKINRRSDSKPPHILFIVMDDLGSADLGIHGKSGIHTPTCDQLIRDGLFLEQYYVLPSCSPTRSALLSGMYPLHTGIHAYIRADSTVGLPLELETLPQRLKRDFSYRTHAVGKWHLGHSAWQYCPTYRGFDSFYGFYVGSADYFTHQLSGGYDMRHDRHPRCGGGCSTLVDERGNYSTHVFAREAIRVIQEHEASAPPLFLYLAFQAVHAPDQVPDEYLQLYRNWTDPKRQIYAGMLTAADEGIRNVTDALKESGLWDDTLVVFTTDNGGPTEICSAQGSSNNPRRGGKCTVWEGGTTGDGFLSGPYLQKQMGIPGGTTYSNLFHAVDWYPTILDIAGHAPSQASSSSRSVEDGGFDGVSQFQSLRGEAPPARKELFVAYGWDFDEKYGPAIRVGDWKLIEGNGGPYNPNSTSPYLNSSHYMLFHLKHDRNEEDNVIEAFPFIAKTMRRKLEQYKATMVPKPDEKNCDGGSPQVNTTFGPTWMPWCSGSSQIVVYQ